MKYQMFNGVLNEKNITKVLDFIQDNEGDLTISIGSPGGNISDVLFLVDVMNANKDRITLVANWYIYSGAFELFYKFKGKRKIINGSQGMTHYTGIQMRMNSTGEPDTRERKVSLNGLKADKANQDRWAGNFMSPKELIDFKKGEDVFFSFERMKQIFPDAEIIE